MPGENTASPEPSNKATASREDVSFWTAPQRDVSFWDVFKWLATYIAVPGVLLYPAGFLVYVLQIWSFYPFSFWTAWYMTSLIPVPVVTGQGVKVLFWPLLFNLLISLLFSWMLIVRPDQLSQLPRRLSSRNLPNAVEAYPVRTALTIVFLIFWSPYQLCFLATLCL